jgi:hypothetical protein|tara:strand:+ start:59 stop:478 length:420 start_codon:yes stop_codon:yes gene_type:complete
MLQKIIVRMKLSDFINTDYEQVIMERYSEVSGKYNVASMLYLWFDEDDQVDNLKEFITRWENGLSLQTKIMNSSSLSHNDWLFFDIRPLGLKRDGNSRFSYEYSTSKQIVKGLDELDKILKFITEDVPTKHQKRNDYED